VPQKITLTESCLYFFDTPARRIFCLEYGLDFPSSGWISQESISRSLFGDSGAATVRACTQSYGIFAWAPEFANVHATFPYEEHQIEVDGVVYGSSETYYQSMKSVGSREHEEIHEAIRLCSPMEAYRFGNRVPLRLDWEDARVAVMRKAIYAKFTHNRSLRELLCETYPHPLVQIKMDPFWGTSHDGSGANMLGVLLQELRDQLLDR
jgi:ribA/ribD-fused uncharacterized protein